MGWSLKSGWMAVQWVGGVHGVILEETVWTCLVIMLHAGQYHLKPISQWIAIFTWQLINCTWINTPVHKIICLYSGIYLYKLCSYNLFLISLSLSFLCSPWGVIWHRFFLSFLKQPFPFTWAWDWRYVCIGSCIPQWPGLFLISLYWTIKENHKLLKNNILLTYSGVRNTLRYMLCYVYM